MTARHCAAVARYAREIAIAAGFSKEEQDLVHTAGLLHDIGKFIFPDRILKGDTKLTDEDWKIIKMHPYQGARVVAQMEGYGPVSEIILAHHERIDGKGYPRGLKGRRDPGAVAHHLGRRHLRRDDRARLLPQADLLVRGDPGAAARRPARSSTPSTSRSSSGSSPARTSASATARTPTSTPSWGSTSASPTTRCRSSSRTDATPTSSRAAADDATARRRAVSSASADSSCAARSGGTMLTH